MIDRRWIAGWIWLAGLGVACGQTGGVEAADAPAPVAPDVAGMEAAEAAAPVLPDEAGLEASVESLLSLNKAIQAKEAKIAELQRQLQGDPDEVTRDDLLEQLRALKDESDNLSRQFAEFSTEVDISKFLQEEPEPFDWQREVGAILQPIIGELKSATAETRVIGELRNEIDDLGKRYEIAEEATDNLEQLLGAADSPALQARLEAEYEEWRQRRDQAANRKKALELQLQKRLDEQESLLDSATGYAQTFFRTRGLNLLMGIGSFCAVFFGLRWLGGLSRRLRGGDKVGTFSNRLLSLFFHAFSVVGAILAMMMVFNATGDWFLLGIVLIFLIGVGWASINTIPQHIETLKLMLNIGPVREGDRILFDGIPWKVEGLGMSAKLVNPVLDGGEQVLPIRYLVGMHSRPPGEDEEWFPCRKGDWVVLEGDRVARVVNPTPSMVTVVELGGVRLDFPTADFVGLGVRQLADGFRIEVVFGIDYKHQGIATTDVPRAMQDALESGLEDLVGPDAIRNLDVEFREASASSLDYEVLLDVSGDQAPNYLKIRRAVSRILVDACNRHGWEIPFQQITLHQA